MSAIFSNFLILHIIFGLGGIIFAVAVFLGFVKRSPKISSLRVLSFLSFLSFIFSWLTGGYYYTKYYGSAVKPFIKAGDYSWIHSVIMEIKEHAFLFLPFLSAAVFLSALLIGDYIERDLRLKKTLSALTFLIVAIGIIITLMGAGISGAVR